MPGITNGAGLVNNMFRIGKFVIGRFVEVARYQALLNHTEERIKYLSSAQTVIVNEMFDNVKKDIKTLMYVYEHERTTQQLLDACKNLDVRITELERKMSGFK